MPVALILHLLLLACRQGHGFLDRTPLLLQMGSVVLLHDSPIREWFVPRLAPWVHYVPLRHDLVDMLPRALEVTDAYKSGEGN